MCLADDHSGPWSQLAQVKAGFQRIVYLSAATLETWGALDTHVDQKALPRERLESLCKRWSSMYSVKRSARA